jgi:hypothetical protein
MWEKGMQEIRWYDAETIATPLMRDLWEESVAALDLMCHGMHVNSHYLSTDR